MLSDALIKYKDWCSSIFSAFSIWGKGSTLSKRLLIITNTQAVLDNLYRISLNQQFKIAVAGVSAKK